MRVKQEIEDTFKIEFRLSQAMTNPDTDKDSVLRDLAAFVSSSTPNAVLNNNNDEKTGEFLTGLSTALRDQLDEVERLAADKGAENSVKGSLNFISKL